MNSVAPSPAVRVMVSSTGKLRAVGASANHLEAAAEQRARPV